MSSSSTSTKIDPESPYYLSNSDAPGNVISSVILNEDNYGSWSRVVIHALKSKNKIGFVNGKLKKPVVDSPEVSAWEKCNSMVVAWLHNIIDPRLLGSITYQECAAGIWTELEERYAQGSQIRIYQLKGRVYYVFSNSFLDDEVYIFPPKGYLEPHGNVCLFKKSLYGLRQASTQ